MERRTRTRAGGARPAPAIDTSAPQSAPRRCDYSLGDRQLRPDRASADPLATVIPTIRTMTRENRHFLARVIEFLTARPESTSSSTSAPASRPPNVHELAQRVGTASRVSTSTTTRSC